MAAALGMDLIFHMAAGEAQFIETGNRARGVHGVAETGIDVDNRRQIAYPGDVVGARDDFLLAGEADIRQAIFRRDAGAGNINAVEAGLFHQHRHQWRESAGKLHQAALRQFLAKGRAFLSGSLVGVDHVHTPSYRWSTPGAPIMLKLPAVSI